MSFTIVTNVFCDRCGNWDSKTGGAVYACEMRREAWRLAKSVGWKKIAGQHVCPKCRLRDLDDRLETIKEDEKWHKDIPKRKRAWILKMEIEEVVSKMSR